MTRKRIICLISIVFLLAGFFARDTIISLTFRGYLKGYCRSCLGGRLSYENIHYENGVWILDHPVIATRKTLDEGGYRFTAEKATIDVTISWMSRLINLAISVESPHLDIGKNAESIKKILENPQDEFLFFHVHSQFDVLRGSCLVHSKDLKINDPLFFSVELACREKRTGTVLFWMDDTNKSSQSVEVLLIDTPDKSLGFQVAFKKIDLPMLWRSFGWALPIEKEIGFSQGILNGNVNLMMSTNASIYAEGNIIADDIVINLPDCDCLVYMPQVSLELTPSAITKDGQEVFQTIGHIDLSHQTRVDFRKNGEVMWKVEDVNANVAFTDSATIDLSADALFIGPEGTQTLKIRSAIRPGENDHENISVAIRLEGLKGKKEHVVSLSARQLPGQKTFANLEILDLGKEEFNFIKHMLGHRYPEWNLLDLHHGTIDASMFVYFNEWKVSEVAVEKFKAHQIEFAFEPLELHGEVLDTSGKFSFDLSAVRPIDTFKANLSVVSGKLNLMGFDQTKWQFTNVYTDLKIDHGILQKSVLNGIVGGLSGNVVLDPSGNGPVISVDFSGKGMAAAQLLPETVRGVVEDKFGADNIRIIAKAIRNNDDLLVDGKMSVDTNSGTNSDIKYEEIDFKFIVESISKLSKELLLGERKNENSANSIWKAIRVTNGYVEATHLPLAKYISPFIFPKKNLKLSGFGDFYGDFNGEGVIVRYNVENLVLENSDFSFEGKELHSVHGEYSGVQYYNFNRDQSYGFIHVQNGIYFEKNTGLLFTDVKAKLKLEKGCLHAAELETFCNGVALFGSADVDWQNPQEGVFFVDIHVDKLAGKMSQMQHIVAHFKKPFLFTKIPLEGDLILNRQGAHLRFDFDPSDYQVQTRFSGALRDGQMTSQISDLAVQEISVDFDYNQKANTLEFSDLLGTVLIGTPSHFEEYTLNSDQIKFTDYMKDQCKFDIRLDDKQETIMRIVGQTDNIADTDENAEINVTIDPVLSHFTGLHPKEFLLKLKGWTDVDAFQLGFDFSFGELLNDLHCFRNTGLFFLSRSLLKSLNNLPVAEGVFNAHFSYLKEKSAFIYEISGKEINLGIHHINEFLLNGKKRGTLWTIDQLQLDDISLAMDIVKEAKIWNVNFLGGRFGNALLFGLAGQYDVENSHISAQINLFEAELPALSSYIASVYPLQNQLKTVQETTEKGDLNLGIDWPGIVSGFKKWLLSGKLHASGTVNLDFDHALHSGLYIDMNMHSSLKNVMIKDLSLQDIENVHWQYNSESGFVLGDFHTMLKLAQEDNWRVSLFLQQGHYNISEHKLLIENLRFCIPSDNLAWWVSVVNSRFPSWISPTMSEMMTKIKPSGNLEGGLRIAVQRRHQHADSQFDAVGSITLDDGTYSLFNKDVDLTQFVIRFNPLSLNISSDYRHYNHPFHVEFKSIGPTYTDGEIAISDVVEGQQVAEMPLTIYWQEEPNKKYSISKIEGSVSGITCGLYRQVQADSQDTDLDLLGTVDIDLSKASAFLDDQKTALLKKWKLGHGYSLQGEWKILKDSTKSIADNIFFNGYFYGQNFELLGYELGYLSSALKYTSAGLEVDNLTVSDKSLTAEIPLLRCLLQKNGEWQLLLPKFMMKGFRPSELHATNTEDQFSTPPTLLISQLQVQDLTGILGKPASFTGKGSLTFTNLPKKNTHFNLLTIPSEILMRIGLDLSVLTPVKGHIEYKIKNAKVEFTHFKDVHSKGDASKFYLSGSGTPSYIDFDGNLHMQIRMKQYNLLFKIAELFTVTVKGTLKDPIYTLQKQPKGREK